MRHRIVIALGGNALGETLPEQMEAARSTAAAIADLIEAGHQVVITHGNGPQVGMISQAMTELSRNHPRHPMAPLSVCVAMSQGYIGYDLQNTLREELLRRGAPRPVATIITQVEVNPDDPAFSHPVKPIGPFMSEEEAKACAARGNDVMEDAGRGWRRVVASPKPKAIVEIESIRALLEAGQVVIACGGGGIPVTAQEIRLKGAGAVIDKDSASALLARELSADWLIILTAVEKVAINFGKPDQKNIDRMTTDEAEAYAKEGQFAPGSMLPKVEAAIAFARSAPGRRALITLLERAADGIAGLTGTVICDDPAC
jgi:carbamate kinase